MATGIRFPASLPVPDRDDYGDQFENRRAETLMEVGTKRRRLLARTSPRIFNVKWSLDQNEFQEFDIWWQETIKGGELEFDVQLSDDFDSLTWYTVRVLGDYSARYLEDGEPYWQVTAKLRALNETFGLIRNSGTSDLQGQIRAEAFTPGQLLVFSPIAGLIEVESFARVKFVFQPLRTRVEVGMYRLPRAQFPAIEILGSSITRQWVGLNWLSDVSSTDISDSEPATRREWMGI